MTNGTCEIPQSQVYFLWGCSLLNFSPESNFWQIHHCFWLSFPFMHFHAHVHSSQSSRSPHVQSFPLSVISMLPSAGFQCTAQARLKSVLPLNCCFLCNRICENGHYPRTLASKPQSPLLIHFPHDLLPPKPSHAPEPMVENSSSGLSAPLPHLCKCFSPAPDSLTS